MQNAKCRMQKPHFRILHFAFPGMEMVLEDRSLARIDTQAPAWGGAELLAAFVAAARWLEQQVDSVNALNVFPVPDGDTGTNLSLTLSGALREVAPDRSCAVVAERLKYWATM